MTKASSQLAKIDNKLVRKSGKCPAVWRQSEDCVRSGMAKLWVSVEWRSDTPDLNKVCSVNVFIVNKAGQRDNRQDRNVQPVVITNSPHPVRSELTPGTVLNASRWIGSSAGISGYDLKWVCDIFGDWKFNFRDARPDSSQDARSFSMCVSFCFTRTGLC